MMIKFLKLMIFLLKKLNQFNDDNNAMDINDNNDDDIKLKEKYIRDIYEYMFDSGKKIK